LKFLAFGAFISFEAARATMKNRIAALISAALLMAAIGVKSVRGQNPSHSQVDKKEIPPITVQEIEALEQFLKIWPDDPSAQFNLAVDYASIGLREDAIHLLQKMAEAHTGLDPASGAERGFRSLAEDPRFKAVVAQVRKENPPVVGSTPAYVIHEKDLAPEGIAYDPVEKEFYVSSLNKKKIICVSADGSVRDFKASGQDGLGHTLGMKVDAKRRILWVVSDSFDAKPGESPGGVFQYDLRTGALKFKHPLPPGAAGFLNDVALASSGDAFATNTGTGEVFRMSPEREGLELFLPAGSVGQANGIAVSPDDKILFIAGWIGVARVEIATKQFKLLAKPRNVSDAGLDGVYFYKGSLVGIQNPDLHPGRVVRYFLNSSWDTIERAEVLDSYNPSFDIPTTATLVGDELYFMANTQLEKFLLPGSNPQPQDLLDIQIVKLKL
jgi:hypothetical protein